jgi:beta-N-acetylhexosaminidase
MTFSGEEIAQLLTIGIPADGDLSAVEELQPGGVILFERNAGPRAEVRRLTRKIEALCKTAPLISIDQEGGRVQRLKDGFTLIPPMRELAHRGANEVSLAAMNVAAELRAVGIHCNLAPVCDVPTHPDDTIISSRAFSSDPIEAALFTAEYVRAAQPSVLCVAKHFPGHGAVGIDSHLALPTYSSTREELEEVHLAPFRAAIGAGVGGIMSGHIAVPHLDPSGTPASLSQPILTGVLREQLGFRGLVFTDDLEMKALPQDDFAGLAVQAIAAGNDMLLICHSPEKARAARDGILDAVSSGALDAARVRDSLERVQWAKRKFGVLAA